LVVLLLAVSSQGGLSIELPYPAPLAGDVVIYVLGVVTIAFLAGEAMAWRTLAARRPMRHDRNRLVGKSGRDLTLDVLLELPDRLVHPAAQEFCSVVDGCGSSHGRECPVIRHFGLDIA